MNDGVTFAVIGKRRLVEASLRDRDHLDDDEALKVEIQFHLGDQAILKTRRW